MPLQLLLPETSDWFEPVDHTGVRSHWIVRGATEARVQVCEMDAAGSAASHVHEEEQQVFHVIEGALVVSDGAGDDIAVRAGESVVIPAGVPHATHNAGDGLCRYLVVTSGAPGARDATSR
jgi:mannose-6-phosphate isomerase-like protein (cupin superfamily)